MVQLKGIDISKSNGSPDFDKIKADGIDFVMIRMGYGSDIASQDDSEFERSVSECERVGLPWGTYLYSYSLNVDSAKSEVEHAKRLLKGKNPKFPVAFDMEDADSFKKKHGMPSNEVLVDICDTFLSGIEEAGYKSLLYASLSWLDNQLDDPKLDKYDKWVAQWSPACTYKKTYAMWQYADNGKVNGIDGSVDMDNCFVDYLGESVPPTPSEPKKHKVIDTVKKIIDKVIHHNIHYSISKGDTFWDLEDKHHWKHGLLQELNPHVNPSSLKVGQMIKIPSELNHTSAPTPKVENKAVVPYPGHLIEEGSSDTDNVKRIQHALGINEDGIFRSETKQSLMDYQKRHGLKVDGICGVESWNTLF